MNDPFRVYHNVGPDGYPPEWHQTVKHLVREQSGHRCERCGHPYRVGEMGDGEWTPCDERCHHGGPMRAWTTEGWVDFDPTPEACGSAVYAIGKAEARYRILTVHHLNGVKADCRWWNLAALCQRCHLRVQRVVVMERVYPWEHTEWFKPHAAGWYAWAFLGEELTRAQTLARLDELLALERVA